MRVFFLFCFVLFSWFLFYLRGFFFVCSVSLIGHPTYNRVVPLQLQVKPEEQYYNNIINIILMLYSPRYSVNITFQGAAANLSYFLLCVVRQVLACFCLHFDVHISENIRQYLLLLRRIKYRVD